MKEKANVNKGNFVVLLLFLQNSPCVLITFLQFDMTNGEKSKVIGGEF